MFRIQLSLVRQWIRVWRQSTKPLEDIHISEPSYFSAMLGSDSCSCARLWRLWGGSDFGCGMCKARLICSSTSLSWCRGRFQWSCSGTTDWLCRSSIFSGFCRGGDSRVQLVELWTGRCMPVVCNDRCRGRCPVAVHRRWWTSLWCRSDKFQLSVLTAGMRVDFLGPCTQVQGREPCPQGHGSHNLMHRLACMDRHVCHTHRSAPQPPQSRDEAGGGTGSARRRRERRLRAYLRYARMSVAMAFSECQHHSAQRPKTARAREEERKMHHTSALRTTVPPCEPELFDLFEEPGWVRPNLLLEPHVSPGPAVFQSLAPGVEYIAPAPTVIASARGGVHLTRASSVSIAWWSSRSSTQ